jgi:16S rRNA (guanine(966)-N(2))-methyltransferase RsmD
MALRITAGIYKNKKLKSAFGKDFRPLSERVKLALFSILGEKVKNTAFLDLFAGTGNVGLEALSRGAAHITMVEKENKKIDLINHNVKSLGVEDKVDIVNSDVFDYISKISFDIIFAGPPYKPNLVQDVLEHLKKNNMIRKETLLIIQHHHKEKFNYPGYNRIYSKKYGITTLDFFILEAGEQEESSVKT